jgi:Protein of unknown function (DUF3035)
MHWSTSQKRSKRVLSKEVMMKKRVLFGCVLVFGLTGCSSLKETLGLGRNAPDEFAVVDRPPLSLPPEFDLKPPKPGAPRPQDETTENRAERVMFGLAPSLQNAETQSDSEKMLLDITGASKAKPEIRDKVDREAAGQIVGNKTLVNDLLWWRKPESKAATVDATEEKKRLVKNMAEKKPVNEGATPIIERQRRGFLGLTD